jgi:hypothetical protein
VGLRPALLITKKGALDSQPQVIKFTSCLPMVGGSLRVLRLLPPLKLVVIILLKVVLSTKNQINQLKFILLRVQKICNSLYFMDFRVMVQSSRWAPVLWPKTSQTLFGPVNFSVYIQNYKINSRIWFRLVNSNFQFEDWCYVDINRYRNSYYGSIWALRCYANC